MAARYVYQGNGLWAYQYTISQIALTTAQQKAIDSGVTEEYLATITSDINSIKDNSYNELPIPSEEYRGRVILLTEKGIDTPYVCLSVHGQYYWMGLSGVGDTYTSILGSAMLGTMILGR